jgi:hypothetical protein
MNNRIATKMLLTLLVTALSACGVKTAVPGFEYPVYTDEKEWPKLAPTTELEQATDVDVEATLEEIEALKRLAN